MNLPIDRPVTLADYLAEVTGPKPRAHRAGQWYFNLLDVARPDLADRVRGTALDPFHRDDRLPAFLAWLADNWDPPAAAPVAPGDRYLAAYAELHELVRRFLAVDANLRYLRRRHAEVEDDLRRALGLLPYPTRDPDPDR